MADAMFIEFSAPRSSRQAPRIRHGAPFNQWSISTSSAINLVPRRAGIDSRPKASEKLANAGEFADDRRCPCCRPLSPLSVWRISANI
jgi:hypothetical protein